jgi:hypothetical protein
MTGFKIGDKVWVKGVINQIDKGNVWDLYISTRENGVWIDSCLDECIPQNDTDEKPRYLRNVLARLRGLPEHDRKVWMDEIMHEFANDYGSVKYTLGYEQGKFDGAVEAEKSNKPVIPQFVADWIEEGKKTCRDVQDLFEFDFNSEEVKRWFLDYKPFDLIARAWLDGYEVEKEKRYKIYIKSTGQALFNDKGSLRFMYKVHADNTGFLFTKSELEEASLGWVFDCEGVEVQEVE